MDEEIFLIEKNEANTRQSYFYFKIAKSYIGIATLAIPYGFQLCGFHLALFLITLNAGLSYFTSIVLIETARQHNHISWLTDLARACYGTLGLRAVLILQCLNCVVTCISCISFYCQELKGILPYNVGDELLVICLLVIVIFPVTKFNIKPVGVGCMLLAVILLLSASSYHTKHNDFQRHYSSFNFSSVPSFFGVCCFAF